MKIGRVIGNLWSTHSLPAYDGRKLMIVQPLSPGGLPQGAPTMAIDYVGAGIGDKVLYSSAPGLASQVFGMARAPINEMIQGIIDRVDLEETR
jgi:ethanolamine utilization protein EutN